MVEKKIRKGWDSKIVFSRLPRKGEKYGINNETLNKAGNYLIDNEVLPTAFFPITDTKGNLSTNVLLKADGEIINSKWENKEQYIVNAKSGEIRFPYGSRLNGKNITASYNFCSVLGYCTGFSATATTALDPAPAIGNRNPIGVTVGTTEITGSVDEYYVDRRLYEQASSLSEGELTSFDIEVISSPNIKNPLVIKFSNAKFSTWSLDFTQDGITSQSCDWTAENVNIYKQK